MGFAEFGGNEQPGADKISGRKVVFISRRVTTAVSESQFRGDKRLHPASLSRQKYGTVFRLKAVGISMPFSIRKWDLEILANQIRGCGCISKKIVDVHQFGP